MHCRVLSAMKAGEEAVPASKVNTLRARIRELDCLLGRKTLEVKTLKGAIVIARGKKPLLQKPLSMEEDFP